VVIISDLFNFIQLLKGPFPIFLAGNKIRELS
jgi:hypothetical protein